MIGRLTSIAIAALVAAGIAAGPAAASGTGAPAAHFAPGEAAAFAKFAERSLAEKGARVAIVFRTGRAREDLPKGVAFTHGAFWVYSTVTTTDGRSLKGYAVHNLYQGKGEAENRSTLVQDYPVDFTIGAVTNDLAVIVPTPELQARLLEVIGSPTYEKLHVPAYSLIANPHDPAFQNCTEFMLDVILAAVYRTDDMARIKANARAYFEPQTITMGPIIDTLAPIFAREITTADHQGAIRTAAFESLSRFMIDQGLASQAYVLEWPGMAAAEAKP